MNGFFEEFKNIETGFMPSEVFNGLEDQSFSKKLCFAVLTIILIMNKIAVIILGRGKVKKKTKILKKQN